MASAQGGPGKEGKYSAHQVRHGVVGPTVAMHPPPPPAPTKPSSALKQIVGGPIGGAVAG